MKFVKVFSLERFLPYVIMLLYNSTYSDTVMNRRLQLERPISKALKRAAFEREREREKKSTIVSLTHTQT